MTTTILARDPQVVGLNYDLEVSWENQKLKFESQILDIDSQNKSEHFAKLDAKLLEYVMNSCSKVKLRFMLVAYWS
nr:unnamed protein product [Callosobruchus chinensis]